MLSYRYRSKTTTSCRPGFWSILLLVSLILVACSNTTTGGSSGSQTSATVTPPEHLVTPGTLTIGTNATYTPMEFLDPATNQYTGFDIELAQVLASRMGLKLEVRDVSFDTLLEDLNNKRFDIVIAAVTVNTERLEKFAMLRYFTAGESILVPKGNPKNITSVDDLCGKSVGVQLGTTQQESIEQLNQKCVDQDQENIQVTVLDSQENVIELLAIGRVDATFQDSPVTDYYNKMNPNLFEVGGSIINSAPYGIVSRQDDKQMQDALLTALKFIQADGTYDKLFDKWGFTVQQKVPVR